MDGRNVSPEMLFRNHHWREILGRPHKIPAAVIVVPGRPRIKKKTKTNQQTHTHTQESFKSATGAWDYKLDALDTTYWHVNLCLSPPRGFFEMEIEAEIIWTTTIAHRRVPTFSISWVKVGVAIATLTYTHTATHTRQQIQLHASLFLLSPTSRGTFIFRLRRW